MYGRKTLRIVPVISSDSDCSDFSEFLGGDPVTPQFIRFMRDYPVAVRAAADGNVLSSSYACNVSASISTQSETDAEYNMRIRRQNKCIKCFGTMGFISCLACLFTCF